jgi:hypothetical protein
MPGTWADAEGAFAPLAGQPLTREQFCVHGGAAYPFILNRPRWDRALPDSRAAASDIKRVALNLAFAEILDGYAFAEIPMGNTRTFAEVLDHYAPARHSFEGFGHLVNWLHVVAKNRVRTVMRRLEQSQPVESRPSRVRRKRLRAGGECPWCWTDVIESPVPLRGNRICAPCRVALPRGVWVGFTETVCQKRAANPLIGPGAPTRVQLDDRRKWPRFTGVPTAPPSHRYIADEV